MPGGTGHGALFSLLVYVDNSVAPVRMDISATDATELAIAVQDRLGLPIASASYWDEEFGEYALLRSLAPLAVQGGRAKLWVATQGVKAMPITEEKDALEYSTIRESVEALTPPEPGTAFELKEIVRVQSHELEHRFVTRRRQLFDPSTRTVLKFYADSQPAEEAAKEGFRLPSRPGPYGLGIIFSSDISVAHAADEVRLLLCEIATGRATTLNNEQDRGVTLEVLRHMGYDSVLARTTLQPGAPRLEEYIVYHPHQAIARYLVTCSFRRGGALGRALGKQRFRPDARLWCIQCGELIAADELLGQHKGHQAKGIEEIAGRERDLLSRCDAILDRTLEQRQKDIAELERMKGHYSQEGRDVRVRCKQLVDDLKGLLDSRYQELLSQVEGKEGLVTARLNQLIGPLQDESAQLVSKQMQLKEALEIARHTVPAAQADFLSRVTDLHNSLNTHPKFDEAPDVTPHAPALALAIDGSAVYESIATLNIEDTASAVAGAPAGRGPIAAHPLGTLALRPEGLLLRDDSLDTLEARLAAVEQGHLWVVPDARQHFAHDQTRDIFSDPFVLGGQTWELKVSFLQGERSVAVYLHAVKHDMRTNFRIAVFRQNRWHVKSTRNWGEEFRGRGWGIKPYILLDELHSFIQNDTLKWLVVFTGEGLY
eukprot:Hpha_TRINITY_DN15176_c0_g13::TRINITY_DN15176_c0_g13_i1::g.127780::m.127780